MVVHAPVRESVWGGERGEGRLDELSHRNCDVDAEHGRAVLVGPRRFQPVRTAQLWDGSLFARFLRSAQRARRRARFQRRAEILRRRLEGNAIERDRVGNCPAGDRLAERVGGGVRVPVKKPQNTQQE